jgi:hypothetical protein
MNRAQYIEHIITEVLHTTLQYHEELNPKIWKDENIVHPDVRKDLLKLATTWADWANIPKYSITDIVLTGGNANYNYTKYSDIDVHLVMHREAMGKDPALIEDYILDKMILWGKEHTIKVKGYPVEIYAQDINMKHSKGQAFYSLQREKWLVKPKKHPIDFDNPHLQRKVSYFMRLTDHLIKSNASDAAFEQYKNKFRDMRNAAMQHGGEFSFENLIYKELRNRGYKDKVHDFLVKRADKKFSIS